MSSVALGEQPKHFSNLLGADAIRYSFASFEVKQFLAIIFSSNGCPIVKAFDQPLVKLQKAYAAAAVQLLALDKLHR